MRGAAGALPDDWCDQLVGGQAGVIVHRQHADLVAHVVDDQQRETTAVDKLSGFPFEVIS